MQIDIQTTLSWFIDFITILQMIYYCIFQLYKISIIHFQWFFFCFVKPILICKSFLFCAAQSPPKGATIPYRPKPQVNGPVILANGQAYTIQGNYAVPTQEVSHILLSCIFFFGLFLRFFRNTVDTEITDFQVTTIHPPPSLSPPFSHQKTNAFTNNIRHHHHHQIKFYFHIIKNPFIVHDLFFFN